MPTTVIMDRPGGANVLRAVEGKVAQPNLGELRVRQTVVGVNFVDVYYRNGLYAVPRLPAVLGFEGAGFVDAVGPDVASVKPGDRVAYHGLPMGAYAEIRVLPADRVVLLPEAMPDRVAGSSMLRGMTAHMLLHKVHRVKPGQWILVHAAAGGLGQLVTRWAKRLGARVVGTVGSEAKIASAISAGADEVFLHGRTDWAERAFDVADGKGVHLAVDGIGGAVLVQTLAAVRPFGVVASLGQPAGPIPPIKVEDLGFARSIGLVRPSSIAYANDPDLYRQGAADLLAALSDGLVNPIGAEYRLQDASQAHADLEAGRTTGSVILTV